MSRATRRRWLVAAALLPLSAAWAQGTRVPTVTRLVKVFLDLETQLQQAARGSDAAALAALLADDFELRVARRPGTPVARAEFLAALARKPPPEAAIEQIAAHDHGAVVNVSFLLRPVGAGRKGPPPIFVVDTWAREGEVWRLRVRYAAAVGVDDRALPGEGDAAPIDKRY